MAIIVRTNISILLDPIICHAWRRTFETYFCYNKDQVFGQVTAAGASSAGQKRKWRSARRQTDSEGSGNINIGAETN